MTDHIPGEDVSYAVENALWIADCVVEHSPTEDYLAVFDRQLETHWDALLALHQHDRDETTDDAGEQLTLPDAGEVVR